MRVKFRGIKRAAALSYLSDIASLLKRVFSLVIRAGGKLKEIQKDKE